MAARIWPVDAVSSAPSYSGRYLRQTSVSPLAVMGSAARPLGAVSGVRPGTPGSIVTATSTTWTVAPFDGVLDGAAAAIAGAYEYSFDTNQTGTVNAAGGSARTDRLDVQVVDPAEGGVAGANPLIQIVYTPGAPSLAAPPAQSHPLAQINVPASGGGSPTVTWSATYSAAAGGVVPFNTYGGLQLWTPPMDGQLAYAADTDNGWAYHALAPTPGWYHAYGRPVVGAYTGGAFGGVTYSAGATTPQVKQRGGRNYIEGNIISTSASFTATPVTVGSIPSAFAPATNPAVFICTTNVTATAQVTVSTTGNITMAVSPSFSGALNLSLMGSWEVKGL